MKYFCYCGKEIKFLVCSWDQGLYYGRPVLVTIHLLCQDHGIKMHTLNVEHSSQRYIKSKYIDKIFNIYLNASTKEIAVRQILAQVIPKLDKLYLPKTDLKKAISQIKKVKNGS